MNTLYIDTSNRDIAKVSLQIGEKRFYAESDRLKKKSQVTLALVDKAIKKGGILLSDIDTIKINKGPGSYTGLRVGMAIANALAFVLGKPLNEKEIGNYEVPKYE